MLSKVEVIELRNIERGKYFRVAADVYLGDSFVEEKLASIYDAENKNYDVNKGVF